MRNHLLLGIRCHTVPIPRFVWQRQVRGDANLQFMTGDHHRVRDFCVTEIAQRNRPLSPDYIGRTLGLADDAVARILDELERNMTFLYRNEDGAVAWAYPVTTDPTPHSVTFASGAQVHAAWAIDAIATPFVQGRLRNETLSCVVETGCGHCHRLLHIQLDSELNYSVREEGAQPIVYVPMVDFGRLEEPSIINDF